MRVGSRFIGLQANHLLNFSSFFAKALEDKENQQRKLPGAGLKWSRFLS
jgi:hypothetical protein